ncbi:MAG: YhjD/YihY/BrkB family envelope integrity protein [Planctomycetota bacterium]
MLKELKEKLERIRWEEAVEPSWWMRLVRRQVGLYFYIARELVRDRCLQQAAALTFTTLLSLVPLFAVAFSFYRSFAGIEGLEERAQDAIFQFLLAGPLIQQVERRPAEEISLHELAGERTGKDLLKDGRQNALGAEDVQAFRLYLAALEQGNDASAVRSALAATRLSGPETFLRAVGELSEQARVRYRSAAELPPGGEGGDQRPSAEGYAGYRRAMDHAGKGEYEEAAAALRQAEAHDYPLVQTRELWGRMHHTAAKRLVAQGELDAATAEYRSALLRYHDAMFVAAAKGSRDALRDLFQGHRQIRQELGELLLRLGKREAQLYLTLENRTGTDAGQALQAAIEDLKSAALMMDDPSQPHAQLARLLWEEAGRRQEARMHYEAALEGKSGVAARGISVAVGDYLRDFINKVGQARIGILATVFLLVTATSLLSTIEKTLNHIWKITESRPFWIKFTSFWTLICLGPVLIGATIWVEETMGHSVSMTFHGMPVLGPVTRVLTAAGQYVLPFITTWLLLVAVYKFLPHTRVLFKNAAWGAFVGAVLLTVVRPLFSLYVMNAITYQKIYGSLGAVPIFLLWLWLLWVIVLFGAEVSFTIQNVGLLRYHDKLRRLSDVFVDRYLAARIVLYVAREFWETGEPVTANRLAEILQITPEEAADAATRLVKLGLLTPVGDQRDEFHPARDLSQLKLSDVLSITDRFRSQSRSKRPENAAYEDRLEAAFRSAIEAQHDALEGLTFRDLLQQCEEGRNKWPTGPSSNRQ